MNRRDLILGAAALSTLPMLVLPAMAQDQRTLTEVSKYLNQLRSVTGRFAQANPNGTRSQGTYYLRRPGFVRFEYDGGAAMVISDGINVGVFDAKSNQGVQKYPLSRSPLRLLLRDNIDLTAEGVARSTSNDGKFTSVRLQDPKRPRDGTMTLVFSNRPPALVRWIARDAQGSETTVALQSITVDPNLDRRLFNIEYAALHWGE